MFGRGSPDSPGSLQGCNMLDHNDSDTQVSDNGPTQDSDSALICSPALLRIVVAVLGTILVLAWYAVASSAGLSA